jgi:hypothetical protein
MLKFPAKALSPPIEDFLEQVGSSPDPMLAMPIRLEHGGGFGGEVHALQAIATWATLTEKRRRTLRLPPAFSEGSHSQERFSSTLPGMAAIYYSDLIESGALKLDRYRALELVAPRVAAMKSEAFGNTIRGQGVALCCFAGARSEFLPALYSHPRLGAVRTISDIRVLISRILHQFGGRVSKSLNEGQLDYISDLTYQLFANADEHGAYGVDGNRYETAIRGLCIRHTTVSEQGVFGADGAFQAYLNRLLVVEPNHGPLRLVEISIFDTGPGMGLRWLAERTGVKSYEEVTVEEELEAVKTCFQKHMTTKAGKYSGQGLSMALAAMRRLGAFMTLRTGRLSLYQDLMRGDTSEFVPSNRFPKRRLELISGTGYTICFRVR